MIAWPRRPAQPAAARAVRPLCPGKGVLPLPGPDILLQTERLTLRRLGAGDLPALLALDGDPEVVRFVRVGVAGPVTRDEVAVRLRNYLGQYARYGGRYGHFAAVARPGPGWLGWFHLRPPADAPDGVATLELGYRLRRACWGRGYATEGALALVARAFADPGVERVVATALAVNAASIRVMVKCGLRWEGDFTYVAPDGGRHAAVRYALPRSAYAAAAGDG